MPDHEFPNLFQRTRPDRHADGRRRQNTNPPETITYTRYFITGMRTERWGDRDAENDQTLAAASGVRKRPPPRKRPHRRWRLKPRGCSQCFSLERVWLLRNSEKIRSRQGFSAAVRAADGPAVAFYQSACHSCRMGRTHSHTLPIHALRTVVSGTVGHGCETPRSDCVTARRDPLLQANTAFPARRQSWW